MSAIDSGSPPALVHRALVYADASDFVDRVGAFLEEGAGAGEETLLLAAPERIDAVARRIGERAAVGLAPNHLTDARLGAAFDDARRFLGGRRGGRTRMAIDWDLTGRPQSERRAFLRWEAAANAIFADFDAMLLSPPRGRRAHGRGRPRVHPEVWEGGRVGRGAGYLEPHLHLRAVPAPAPPAGDPMPLADPWSLSGVRAAVVLAGIRVGIDDGVLADFEIAVNEVAANALWHARGPRDVRIGVAAGALVCEVRDAGPGLDPLAAHRPPAAGAAGGRGLWIAHQLSDVVQVIPHEQGTRVRLEVGIPGAARPEFGARSARGEGGGGPA